MNIFILITLFILTLVVIYYIYIWFFASGKSLTKSVVDLSTPSDPITLPDNMSNNRYAYGLWFFVNNVNEDANVLFYRQNSICLYIKPYTPQLYCIINTGAGTTETLITDNVQLQKWVNLIISVDGQFVDYYLNGKLIKSEKKLTQRDNSSDAKTIYLGNSGYKVADSTTTSGTAPNITTTALFPINQSFIKEGQATYIPFKAYVTKFKRWEYPISPQSAWNEYSAGDSSQLLPYSLKINLLKNNAVQSSYQMW